MHIWSSLCSLRIDPWSALHATTYYLSYEMKELTIKELKIVIYVSKKWDIILVFSSEL